MLVPVVEITNPANISQNWAGKRRLAVKLVNTYLKIVSTNLNISRVNLDEYGDMNVD